MVKSCLKCGKTVSKNCRFGYCNHCRDRSGKNNPFYGRKHSRETIDAAKVKLSLASKKNWEDAAYREKVVRGVSKPRRFGFRAEQSVRIKKWYAENPRQRQARSVYMKKSWSEGAIVRNGYSCNRSKMEDAFFGELSELCDFAKKQTVRDGERWLFPDAVNFRDRIVVEFYGDFWHANPKTYKAGDVVRDAVTAKEIWDKDEARIRRLEMLGFRVFVVWQSDFVQIHNSVVSQFDQLLNWESCAL